MAKGRDAVHEARILQSFNDVPEYIRGNIEIAAKWARRTLRDHEGSGHEFHVTAAGPRHPGMVVCSFAKPEWPGDHCSRPMEDGAEAIVMAVAEYFNGA